MIPNPPKASAVAELLGLELRGPDMQVTRPMPVDDCEPGAICFSGPGTERFHGKGVLLLTSEARIDNDLSHIVCENPRLSFARVLQHYFVDFGSPSIAPSATVGKCVTLGAKCIIKPGAIVGYDGFGFEKDAAGVPVRIPHIGGVTLGAEVEVGANTVIARGTMGNTVIGDHVKLDDLVFVAHNVRIGARTMVVAKAEISGSVRIGEDVWVGAGACIREHLTIGHHAVIGMGAVVVKDVPPGVTVVGNPARPLG